jgi:hypothetical protein
MGFRIIPVLMGILKIVTLVGHYGKIGGDFILDKSNKI